MRSCLHYFITTCLTFLSAQLLHFLIAPSISRNIYMLNFLSYCPCYIFIRKSLFFLLLTNVTLKIYSPQDIFLRDQAYSGGFSRADKEIVHCHVSSRLKYSLRVSLCPVLICEWNGLHISNFILMEVYFSGLCFYSLYAEILKFSYYTKRQAC